MLAVRIAGEPRFIAVEDAARYRDALGVPLPAGIPESLLQPVARSARRSRAALRAHARAVHRCRSSRRATASASPAAEAVLMRLAAEGRLLEGEFRPGGTRREWTDADVLRMLRRRSLAKLRHEVEPVDQAVLGRFATTWQGIVKRRHGADALLDAIEQLQGAPLPASILETRDPAGADRRLRSGRPRRGDRGRRSRLGRRRVAGRARRPRRAVSGRSSAAAVAADAGPASDVARAGPPTDCRTVSERETAILDVPARARRVVLRAAARRGRRRLSRRRRSTRCGTWSGRGWSPTTRSTRCARSRDRAHRAGASKAAHVEVTAFRSRRLAPPSAEGRWTLVAASTSRDGRQASARSAKAVALRDTHQMGRRRHAAAARAPRRRHARSGGGRRRRRRLRHRLSRAERHGRDRAHPPRLFRRRPRRDAVRDARRARSAAIAARCAGRCRRSRSWPRPIPRTRTAPR